MIFAAVLTALVLHYSFRHGRLSIFPSFDDIGYMADGMQRLETLYGPGNIRDFLHEYRIQPPHSPYSDLMAMAAFAVFGPHDWAPYVANGLLMLAFFVAADRLMENVRPWQRVVCLLFLATVPLMAMGAHEFRPDHAVSLATAFGILITITKPLIRSPLRHKLAVGGIFGLAMLIKPPVFPATTIFFFASVSLSVICDWLTVEKKPTSRELANTFIACLVPFVLIPLPHYYINGRNILVYINEVLFGRLRDSYVYKGSKFDEFMYYFNGHGGKIMLGTHVITLTAILLIGAIAVLIYRRREEMVRSVAIVMMLVLSAAIPIYNHTKSEFFGLTMDILMALTAIYVLGRLAAGERTRGVGPVGSVVIVIAAIFGILFFQWPTKYGNFSTDWVRNRVDIVNGIYNSIFDHTIAPPRNHASDASTILPSGDKVLTYKPRVMFTMVGDVNPALFQFMAKRDLHEASFIMAANNDKIEDYLTATEHADFIIAGEQGSELIADFLPGFHLQDELLQHLRHRADLREIGYFPFIRTGKGFALFMRVDYSGWSPVAGVGEFEGPLQKEDERIYFWGQGPATKLKLPASAAGPCELYFESRNGFPVQIITVKVDGVPVAKENAGNGVGFSEHHVPLMLTAGPHDLDLDYTQWETNTKRPMAVLFRAMRIQPKQ